MFETSRCLSPRAIVFGSINTDLVAKTPQLPVPGETLLGHEFLLGIWGKGKLVGSCLGAPFRSTYKTVGRRRR